MDSLSKWYAHFADVKTLLGLWEAQERAGKGAAKRCREIATICLFTVCLENQENQRFMIGFQRLGIPVRPGSVGQLFKNGFGEVEDCDVILAPDYGPADLSERTINKYQLVGYRNRKNPNTADLIGFIENKKLRRATPDQYLRLLVHLEQPFVFNSDLFSAFLAARKPRCPYSRIYVLGATGEDEERCWLCWQVFPDFIRFRDTRLKTARALVLDRKTVCEFVAGPEPADGG